MPIALSTVYQHLDGNNYDEYIVECALSGTYPTGGESLAAVFRTAKIKSNAAPLLVQAQDKTGYGLTWDRANNKLMVFVAGSGAAAPAEHAAATYAAALTTTNPILIRVVTKKNV